METYIATVRRVSLCIDEKKRGRERRLQNRRKSFEGKEIENSLLYVQYQKLICENFASNFYKNCILLYPIHSFLIQIIQCGSPLEGLRQGLRIMFRGRVQSEPFRSLRTTFLPLILNFILSRT